MSRRNQLLAPFLPPPHSQLPQMIQPQISSANSAPPTLEIETPPRPLWARYMLHSLHLPLTPLRSPFHSHHPGCNKSSYHTAPGFPTRSGRPVVSHTISMHLQPPLFGYRAASTTTTSRLCKCLSWLAVQWDNKDMNDSWLNPSQTRPEQLPSLNFTLSNIFAAMALPFVVW